MMPLARESVEPLAAVTVAAEHQSLLHFVGNAPWSVAAMLTKVGESVLTAIEARRAAVGAAVSSFEAFRAFAPLPWSG
jgi:SRSO17 transposase